MNDKQNDLWMSCLLTAINMLPVIGLHQPWLLHFKFSTIIFNRSGKIISWKFEVEEEAQGMRFFYHNIRKTKKVMEVKTSGHGNDAQRERGKTHSGAPSWGCVRRQSTKQQSFLEYSFSSTLPLINGTCDEWKLLCCPLVASLLA